MSAKFNPLYNFISPITGRLVIPKDYILVGDDSGFSHPSSALIDLKLDFKNAKRALHDVELGLIELKLDFKDTEYALIDLKLDFISLRKQLEQQEVLQAESAPKDAAYVLTTANPSLDSAQALDKLGACIISVDDQGILKQTELQKDWLWLGEDNNRPTPVATILQSNLPSLAENKLWLGDNQSNPTPVTQIQRINLPPLTKNLIWQGDNNNAAQEVTITQAGAAPKDATYLLKTTNPDLSSAQALESLLYFPGGEMLKRVSGPELALAIGGDNLTDDYVDPLTLLKTKTVLENEISTARSEIEGEITVAKGELQTEITAVQADLEAQLAAITGYGTLGLLANFVGIGVTTGYTQHLWDIYKPLRTENKYSDTDDYNKQGGNIWFDASNYTAADEYRPGLRITSWDSSWLFASNLYPVSIGLFGYANPITNASVKIQKGFVWQAEMENDSSKDHYRFPKNITLRYVGANKDGIGWSESDYELMKFDYYTTDFTFRYPIKLRDTTDVIIAINDDDQVTTKKYVDDAVAVKTQAAISSIKGTPSQIDIKGTNGEHIISLAANTQLPGPWLQVPVSYTDANSNDNIDNSKTIMLRFNSQL